MTVNWDPFDDIEGKEETGPQIRPFWTLDFEDEDKLLDWLNSSWDLLRINSQDKRQRIKKNLALYKGIYWQTHDIRSREILTRTNVPVSRNPKAMVNHFFDFVEQHVSKTTKFRPAIAVDPANDEWRDKMASKTTKEIIDAIWYKNDIDTIFQLLTRARRLCGEVFPTIEWNDAIGDLHPDAKEEFLKALHEGKEKPRIPLVDDSGKQIHDQNGNPLYIDKLPRIGDVDIGMIFAWQMELQRKKHYKDVEWGMYVDLVDVEDLKAQYPNKADDLKSSKSSDLIDFQYPENIMNSGNKIEKFCFWHRHTTNLESGRRIVFTKSTILEQGVNFYAHGDFPWLRYTDLDIPGQLDGMSLMDQVRPLQVQHSNIFSMNLANIAQVSYPKWMVPRGSVKIESLGNDRTIVQYQGAQPPTLAMPNSISSDTTDMMDRIEQSMEKLTGVYGTSRGEPPKGIKAGVALQFLDEQENERSNIYVAKHNTLIKDMAKRTASVAGQFYGNDDKEDDLRLNQLLGPRMAAHKKHFKMADLTNIYDIRLQTSSALPTQKAARIQTVLDLRESFPERITDDQALDMLEFGAADEFIDIATVAQRASEEENEMFLHEGKADDPKIYEDHMVHYKNHLRVLNEKVYKLAPKKVQEAVKDHIMAHEMLMMEIVKKNPQYGQLLSQLYPAFPMFYKDEGELAQVIQEQQMAQQQMQQQQMQQQQMAMEQPMIAQGMGGPVQGGEVFNEVGIPNEAPVEAFNQAYAPGEENILPTGLGLEPTEGV